MIVLYVLLFVAAVAAVIWFSYYRKRQRRLALAAFASGHGLQFSQEDPFGLLDYPFHLLSMGDGRGCENVLSGRWQDIDVREADYWYYTESTDSKGHRSRSYKYYSIVIAEIAATIPYVSVQRETFFTKLADHVGLRDIDFESEDFNRAFNVKGEDREFCFKIIDGRMMQWLLSTGGRLGFEMRGSNVLVYCHRLAPAELDAAFGAVKGFNDHVPRLVWTEFGTVPGQGTQRTERSTS
jgi:hypothetical protein